MGMTREIAKDCYLAEGQRKGRKNDPLPKSGFLCGCRFRRCGDGVMFVVIKNPLFSGFKVTVENDFLGVRVGCENVPVERTDPETLVADCAKREIVTCGNGVFSFHDLDFLVFELVSVGLVPLDMRKMGYFLSYVNTQSKKK